MDDDKPNRYDALKAQFDARVSELIAANSRIIEERRIREATLQSRIDELEREKLGFLQQLNTPELQDFSLGVVREAQHQRERWGVEHDAGKAPEDWFWLLGYLGGKALRAAAQGDTEKALHHTISTAAALANWHAQLLGSSSLMRPGIGPGSPAWTDRLASETGE